jgi:hypothetical protein
MWLGLLDYFRYPYYSSTGMWAKDFYHSPKSRIKGRVGAYQKPKAKISKHRKFIKKMKGG